MNIVYNQSGNCAHDLAWSEIMMSIEALDDYWFLSKVCRNMGIYMIACYYRLKNQNQYDSISV